MQGKEDKTFVTFKSFPMRIQHCTRFAIFYSETLSHPLENLSALLFSSLLALCGVFGSFLLSKSIKGRSFYQFQFQIAFQPYMNLQNTSCPGSVWKLQQGLTTYATANRSQRSSRQSCKNYITMPFLIPHVIFHPHSSIGDTPCMCNANSVT